MERLASDDQFVLLSTKLSGGLEALQSDDLGIENAAVVRFGTDHIVAFSLAHMLAEQPEVMRLLRQMDDKYRPDGIKPWTMADHLAHIGDSMPEHLPNEVREALENLMRVIEEGDYNED